MSKIIIFGNSGSGKSTLAKNLSLNKKLAHLDLDTIAWKISKVPERKSIEESKQGIQKFIESNNDWVIEGCYSSLIEIVITKADELIFLDLSSEKCISNAKNRPWEPHKYKSKEDQDKNLEMLINWISKYYSRSDEFSREAHLNLFQSYSGKKVKYTDNIEY